MSENQRGGGDAYGFLDAARGTRPAPTPEGRAPGSGAVRRQPASTRARRGRRNKAEMKRATGFVRADVYRRAVRAMEDMEPELRRELKIGDEPLQFGHLMEMLLVDWLESLGEPADEVGG